MLCVLSLKKLEGNVLTVGQTWRGLQRRRLPGIVPLESGALTDLPESSVCSTDAWRNVSFQRRILTEDRNAGLGLRLSAGHARIGPRSLQQGMRGGAGPSNALPSSKERSKR